MGSNPPDDNPDPKKPAALPPPGSGNFFGDGSTFTRQDASDMGAKLTETLRSETALIDQKVDLKMSGLEREINAKLDGKPGHLALVAHTIATIGVIITVIVTVLAIGGDRFDGGMSASGALATQMVEFERHQADLNSKIDELGAEIKALRSEQSAEKQGGNNSQ